jgi:hypothetical protein
VNHYQELGLLDPPTDGDRQRAIQMFALVTLYYATGGETSWVKTDRWLQFIVHECRWQDCCCGARCSNSINEGTGPLTGLELFHNAMVNSLPREIGLLTDLKVLGLANNTISGSIPVQLGDLLALTKFLVWTNQFTTTIPTQVVF